MAEKGVKIDLSKVLRTFDDRPFQEEEKDVELKTLLTRYIRVAQNMVDSSGNELFTESELEDLYDLACLASTSEGVTEVTAAQYSLIKKMAQSGKMKRDSQSGEITDYVWSLELRIPLHRYLLSLEK